MGVGTVGRGLCGAVWGGVGWGEQVEERGRLVREMAGDSVVDIADEPADPDNRPAGVRDALDAPLSPAASTLTAVGDGRDLDALECRERGWRLMMQVARCAWDAG